MKECLILDLLRHNKVTYVSGEEISKKLKVSRSAIWKEIQSLRRLGYEIEAQPHRGYRLAGIPDKLFADELSADLGTRFIGKEIVSYDELDSTNDTAFSLGENGSKEGTIVFTEFQKKGRGRLGRSWESPKGKNLILSVLLRPRMLPQDISKLTLACAVSVIKAVKKMTGKTLGIKWPNDIYYENKKVGGILTEMSAESDRINFIVVGIGINLNSEQSQLPPGSISLKEITGSFVNRVLFGQELLRELETDYLRLKNNQFEELVKDWETYSVTSGHRVIATLFGRKIEGQAIGIDKEGALWIRQDNGFQERIVAGDVEHLWSKKV
ncbi:MAG: biotin--[acetyl-CoA-carboxylase] ligase [Candidatus Omnitrophica bacterium CG1_02_49_16]|nr:MAG: biotin--[acetyl-CoA-carboxylase] ligase [Candidatus Omnitrophica bacterium CG1_02_49_16]